MGRHAALLRGINVGGRNMLPMKALARMFADAGCRDVVTYIQSGNVVFDASVDLARRIPTAIAKRIAADFGLTVPVLLRSAAEWRTVVDGNPFLPAEPIERVHVMCLADTPPAKAAARLDPDRSPPDRFVLRGREVYLCLPNGAGRTRLTNDWFDRQLGTTSTVRNWKTVLELQRLLAGPIS